MDCPGAWHNRRYRESQSLFVVRLSGFPLIRNKEFLRINLISAKSRRSVPAAGRRGFRSSKKVDQSGEQSHFRSFLEKNLQLKIPVQ